MSPERLDIFKTIPFPALGRELQPNFAANWAHAVLSQVFGDSHMKRLMILAMMALGAGTLAGCVDAPGNVVVVRHSGYYYSDPGYYRGGYYYRDRGYYAPRYYGGYYRRHHHHYHY